MPASRTPANFYHLAGRLDESIPVMYNDSVTSDPFAWFDIESNHFGVGPLGSQPLSLPVSPSTPSSSSSSSPTASLPNDTKTNGRRRDPGHIPRPRNAFILFRTEYIKGEPVEEGQTQLSKNAGTAWQNMSSEEKRPYHERAAMEKEAHAKKYPGYIYAPRRRNKTNVKRNGTPRQKDRITGPLPSPANTFPEEPVESGSKGSEFMESWSFPQIPLHNHSSFVDRMSMTDQYVDPFGIFSAPDLTTLPPLPKGANMTTDNDVFAEFLTSHWSTNGSDNFEDMFPHPFEIGSTANPFVVASNPAATSTISTTIFTAPSHFASSSSFDFPFPSSSSSHLDSIFPDFTNSFDARQYFSL